MSLDSLLQLAVNAHHGQRDKVGKPYILHPLKVMHYLKSDDWELCAIALLHDVIEDTKTTYKELREAGATDRIVEGVRCLTKLPGETLEEYVEKVCSNVDAMEVKLCDLRHNTDIRRLKGLTEKDFARLQKYQTMYATIKAKLAGTHDETSNHTTSFR